MPDIHHPTGVAAALLGGALLVLLAGAVAQHFRKSREERAVIGRAALDLFSIFAAMAVLFVIAHTRADVDLWGHVRFGLDILESGRLDATDPYSFTSDRPWINHEWLSELLFGAAWTYGGNAGLICVKLACTAAALLLVVSAARRDGAPAVAAVAIAAVALLGTYPRLTLVRPQIFSVLFFAVLLWVCLRAEHRGAWSLAASVPLLCVWANLHGGWIVGLATLAAWTAGDVWSRRAEGLRLATLLIPAAAAAATLANPYGVGLWAFLLETVRLGREGITEWGPIWSNPARTLVWTGMMAVTGFALLSGRAAGADNPARLLVPLLWGLASFNVNRLDAFFALSVLMLLAPRVAAGRLGTSGTLVPHRPPARYAVLAGATLIAAVGLPGGRRALTCIEVTRGWWPEPEAAGLVDSRGFSGRMVTYFNWGEYAIWHLPRVITISFDGRRETVYSDAVIEGHLELYAGTPRGLEYLESLNAQFIWFPRDLEVVETLKRSGWSPVFSGPRSVILQRGAGGSAPVEFRQDESARSACFPGASILPEGSRR